MPGIMSEGSYIPMCTAWFRRADCPRIISAGSVLSTVSFRR